MALNYKLDWGMYGRTKTTFVDLDGDGDDRTPHGDCLPSRVIPPER